MSKRALRVHVASLGFLCTLISALAFGQAKTDEHAGHHPADKPAAAAPANPAPEAGAGGATMQSMQDNMKKMQELMARIHATQDATERRKLLQEHQAAMGKQMDMMKSMGGGMMMGMMSRGGMTGGKGGMQCGDTAKCQEMMETRLDMMQMMMEQMTAHDAMERAQPPK